METSVMIPEFALKSERGGLMFRITVEERRRWKRTLYFDTLLVAWVVLSSRLDFRKPIIVSTSHKTFHEAWEAFAASTEDGKSENDLR